MNTTVATILGTVALGLIKSKMGSGIRIKKQPYIFLTMTYFFNLYHQDDAAYNPSGIGVLFHQKEEFMRSLESVIEKLKPIIKREGFDFVGVKIDILNIDDDPDDHVPGFMVRITISQDVDDEDILSEWKLIKEAQIDQSDTYLWWQQNGGAALEKFDNEFINYEIHELQEPMIIGDDFNYGFDVKIVNADTGEEYKTTTKKSNLRKR